MFAPPLSTLLNEENIEQKREKKLYIPCTLDRFFTIALNLLDARGYMLVL